MLHKRDFDRLLTSLPSRPWELEPPPGGEALLPVLALLFGLLALLCILLIP